MASAPRNKPTRRQHFVPQWYLKEFSADGKKLHTLDKASGRTFHTSTSKLAVEKDFYTLPSDPPDEEPIAEKLLTIAEAEAAKVVRRVLRRIDYYVYKFPDLQNSISTGEAHSVIRSPIERAVLAHFMLLQAARTPARRLGFEQAEIELLKWTKDLFSGRDDIDLSTIDPDKRPGNETTRHVSAMFSEAMLELSTEIASWSFVFHYKRHGRPLYTSDNPVIQRDKSEIETVALPFRLQGLEGKTRNLSRLVCKTVYYFPLSSRVLLLILGGRHGGLVPAIDGRVLEMDDSDEACGAQVLYARRQVYCGQNDFGLARHLLREYPEHVDPDRQFGGISSIGEVFERADRRTKRSTATGSDNDEC